jgi:hypothetical protein
MATVDRAEANKRALQRILEGDPVLLDVRRAIDVVPGMTSNVVLHSGPSIAWGEISGVQRTAILNAAVYEGLASTTEDADAKLRSGEIPIDTCAAHGCVGIATGLYTASTPVYVVENKPTGNRAFCGILEGNPPRAFVFGAMGDDVVERLKFVENVYMPVLSEALKVAGGIPLKPLFRRALTMGDELHLRTDAGTQLFISALAPHLLGVAREREREVRQVLGLLQTIPYSFLRVVTAAAKAIIDSAHGIEGSSVVTGMIQSCKDFAIRISGLGDEWFRGPSPEYKGTFFWGSTVEDIGWGGGESNYTETIGLGAFAQVAAFTLPFRPIEGMVERNRQMYDITLGENQEFKINYFDRGVPVGIDLFKVIETGIPPAVNAPVIRKDGNGLAGMGPMLHHMDVFETAAAAFKQRYG